MQQTQGPVQPPRGGQPPYARATGMMPLYDDPYAGRTISSADPHGRPLHSYHISRKIDEGGMGVVYEGRSNGTRVAVKFIGRDLATTNDKLVERFARETQAMVRINHPNVVKILDFGTDSGRMFIVMEYIEGRSLQDILRDTGGMPLKWKFASNFLLQICDAIAAAHGQGVWHRDIKPSNVLITHGDHVKVIDFGAAKLDDSTYVTITTTGRAIGTYFYMSPEVLQGFSYDHRVDIYSLGVLMYQFLYGSLPFNGTSEIAVVAQILNPSEEFRQSLRTRLLGIGIPPHVADIPLTAMQHDPAARYQTVRDMREAIDSCGWDGSNVLEHVETHHRRRPGILPFWLKAATTLAVIGGASFAAYHFRGRLAAAYNEHVVPALLQQGVRLPPTRAPPKHYSAYIDSRPRGARVYEIGPDGTPGSASLGATPLSREFTGTHTLAVGRGDRAQRVSISPEAPRVIVTFPPKKPGPRPSGGPDGVQPVPAEVETVYVDE